MQSHRYPLSLTCVFSILISVQLLAQAPFAASASQLIVSGDSSRAQGEMIVQPSTAKAPAKFAKAVIYGTAGWWPASVAIGDLNGDGHPDLAVVNQCPSLSNCDGGIVSVLLGNGDGTFQSPVSFSSGGYLGSAIAIADVNGDGKLDLIVTNSCQSECSDFAEGGVSVLLGNGDGTFQAPVVYDSGGLGAGQVVIADLTGNGKLDLVIANRYQCSSCSNGGVSILLGNGDGTFQPPVSYSTVSASALSVAVGDVNGDGIPDLAVSNNFGPVVVLLGNGNGTFQPAVNTSMEGWFVTLGDVNGDGILDMAVTLLDGVEVALGNGNGTFQTPVSYVLHAYEGTSIAIRDVNGDGKNDMVVTFECGTDSCSPGYGEVYVLSGNGDGTFNSVFSTSTGGHYAGSAEVGDVNGDGRPDIVFVNACGLTVGEKECFASATGSVGVILNELTIKTTTHVTSSADPSQVNESVTITATIVANPSVPNQEVVTFYNGTSKIGTATTVNGLASLTTSFSAAGKYTIKASYPGDAFHEASSGTVKQRVQ